MKQLLNVFIGAVVLLIACNTVEPVIEKPEPPKWELIPELSQVDGRYMLKHNDELFLSTAVYRADSGGALYSTKDGHSWNKLIDFPLVGGPLAINGDSLFVLNDSLYKYIIPEQRWVTVCPVPYYFKHNQMIGEMVILNGSIYAMQTFFGSTVCTYRLNWDGTADTVFVLNNTSYGGAKFLKYTENGKEKAYVRGHYFAGGMYTFDSEKFTTISNGLTEHQFYELPTNSMALHNDTLFAGFRFPSTIKYLHNNTWSDYTDSLPYSKSALLVRPRILTESTAIVWVGEQMYVSTQCQGVFKLNAERKWERMSEGLPFDPIIEMGIEDFYHPIPLFESAGNYLIVGYGEPSYGRWGGKGVYRFKIQ